MKDSQPDSNMLANIFRTPYIVVYLSYSYVYNNNIEIEDFAILLVVLHRVSVSSLGTGSIVLILADKLFGQDVLMLARIFVRECYAIQTHAIYDKCARDHRTHWTCCQCWHKQAGKKKGHSHCTRTSQTNTPQTQNLAFNNKQERRASHMIIRNREYFVFFIKSSNNTDRQSLFY